MMSTFSKENLSFVFDKFLQATRIKDLLNPISGIEIFFLFLYHSDDQKLNCKVCQGWFTSN